MENEMNLVYLWRSGKIIKRLTRTGPADGLKKVKDYSNLSYWLKYCNSIMMRYIKEWLMIMQNVLKPQHAKSCAHHRFCVCGHTENTFFHLRVIVFSRYCLLKILNLLHTHSFDPKNTQVQPLSNKIYAENIQQILNVFKLAFK